MSKDHLETRQDPLQYPCSQGFEDVEHPWPTILGTNPACRKKKPIVAIFGAIRFDEVSLGTLGALYNIIVYLYHSVSVYLHW